MPSHPWKILNTASLGLGALILATSAVAQPPSAVRGSFARTLGPASAPYHLNNSGIAVLSNGVVVTAFECERFAPRSDVARFCLVFSRDGKVLKRVQTYFRPTRRGDDGLAYLSYTGHVEMAVDSRDRIVVAGYGESNGALGPIVGRWLPRGALDRSFGTRGMVHLPVGLRPGSVAVDSQDRVLLAGSVFLDYNTDPLPPNWGLRLYRLGVDGSLDPTFGDSGAATVDVSDLGTFVDSSAAVRMHVDAQGRTTLATFARDHQVIWDATPTVTVARVLPDGSLDPSFGQGGRALHVFPAGPADGCGRIPYFFPKEIAFDSTGRILIAVESSEPHDSTANGDVGVVALRPDGALDPAFGVNGLSTFHVPLILGGMAVQPDGNLVLGGVRDRNFGQDLKGTFMAVRILADGSALDPAFGDAGVTEGRVISAGEHVISYDGDVLVTPGGHILVSGVLQPADRLSRFCRLPVVQGPYACAAVKAFGPDGAPEPSLEEQRQAR